MRWRVEALAAILGGMVLYVSSAAAEVEPQRIGAYRDWETFAYVDGSEKVCYSASRPVKAEGNYTKRGDIHLVVARRVGGDEISVYPGYVYKKDSEVQIAIGPEKFQLFTHEGSAWTKNPDHDKLLLTAMRKAGDMVVVGTSSRGTVTTDTFSLRGLTQALEEAERACPAAKPKASPPPARQAQPEKAPAQPAQKAPAQKAR
ncbi:MAG: hypothetical protein EXQ96_02160 [Alphaproteobacteria bacterium]|nr:hypothetical protein [Alphaproteobacteria bacterium]